MAIRKRITQAVTTATALVAIGGTTVALSSPASAASTAAWNQVAQCESGGNWSINTGNGFYGGLQFTHSTWKAFGGKTANAHQASKAHQIEIANKVLAGQGKGAWPNCGKFL